jgi:hypothetical protein
MAEESDSLKEEMSALLRGDLERARQKRDAEVPPAPEPEHQPEPERRLGLFRRRR